MIRREPGDGMVERRGTSWEHVRAMCRSLLLQYYRGTSWEHVRAMCRSLPLQYRRGGDVWADDMGASIIEMGGSYAQICAAERVVGVCIEFQHLLFLGHFSSLDRSNSETDFMKHGFEI